MQKTNKQTNRQTRKLFNLKANNQNPEMLTAVMFPVVSANSRPTHPALRVCVSYVSFPGLTHTCLGVRPPLGVSGPGKWQLMSKRLTPVCLSAEVDHFRSTSNSQRGEPFKFPVETAFHWGRGPFCHDLPGGVAFIVSAKSPFGDIA